MSVTLCVMLMITRTESFLNFYKEIMEQKSKIAILGGGGRTGKFLVAELLRQQYPLKLLLRAPDNFTLQHGLIEIVKGNATDPGAIDTLLQDCHAVISTVGQRKAEPLVTARSTENIMRAMEKYKIRRYLLLSGLSIDTPFDKKGSQTLAATAWMKANFPRMHEDWQKAYSILAICDLDWTLLRVPWIEFNDSKNKVEISLEDCRGASITAGDIADFLTQQLSDDQYVKQSPFIANA
jgi:putative NADH-flavin reductase